MNATTLPSPRARLGWTSELLDARGDWRSLARRALVGAVLASLYGLALGARDGQLALLTHAVGVPAALLAVCILGVPSLYIVLAHRLARSPGIGSIDGLAAAILVAALFVTPVSGWSAAPALVDPVALAAGVGVGVTSSVIPYVLDQLAMARLSRATYSLMVSLLPATAVVIGVLVLAQIPSMVEIGGVALVVAAMAVHRERPGV